MAKRSSGFVARLAGKTRYTYNLPNLQAEGILESPEELFGPGGLQRIAEQAKNSIQQQNQRDSSTRTATDASAAATGPLTQPQRAMSLSDPIPVVFARRRTGGTGGVLVFPRATEAQFSSDGANLTARYHCILGDGQVSGVQVRDVRKGYVREGTFSQNYNQRAGAWAPGNRLTNLQGINPSDYPLQCGGGGDYTGVSTIEFSSTHPFNSDRWKQTWSAFVRGGINLTRIHDNTYGPTDNIVDLVTWAMINSGRMTAADIDMDAMLKAARFIEVNQLFCNGIFDTRSTLPDFLLAILPAFLLRETTINGRFALAPLPPVASDGTLITGPLRPTWILTEEVIAPGSVEVRPSSAATAAPLEISVGWRQQTSDVEPPLDRDLIVGVSTDLTPLREEWDLRGFVTSESHAALVGGWRHAVRTIGAATARVEILRGAHTGYMRQGQVLHLFLQVVPEIEAAGQISGYWFVEQVSLNPDGSESLDLSACPVDAEGQCLLTTRALAFQAAAPGIALPYPVVGVSDLAGRAADSSVPAAATNPSIIPLSRGGAVEMVANFNRSSLPPAGPPSTPPAPPTDGGGGNGVVDGGVGPMAEVIQAGGDPTGPNQTKGRGHSAPWPRVYYDNSLPGDTATVCEYGEGITVMNVSGFALGANPPGTTGFTATVQPPAIKRELSAAELVTIGGTPTFVVDGVTYFVRWYELIYNRAIEIGDSGSYTIEQNQTVIGDTDWVDPDTNEAAALTITYDDRACNDRSEGGNVEGGWA